MSERKRPSKRDRESGRNRGTTVTAAALCVLLALAATTAAAQDLVLGLTARAGDLTCDLHEFGFRSDADSGADYWDLAEPPLPPGDYLSMHFRMAHLPFGDPGRWRADIRDVDDFLDQLEYWELVVESSVTGVICEFDVTVELGDASGIVLSFDRVASHAAIAPPGVYGFEITQPSTVIRLALDRTTVPAESVTWGGIRCLYD